MFQSFSSSKGYLQRCLVKHMEALKARQRHTQRCDASKAACCSTPGVLTAPSAPRRCCFLMFPFRFCSFGFQGRFIVWMASGPAIEGWRNMKVLGSALESYLCIEMSWRFIVLQSQVAYDHTVRDSDGSILQFLYGEVGLGAHRWSLSGWGGGPWLKTSGGLLGDDSMQKVLGFERAGCAAGCQGWDDGAFHAKAHPISEVQVFDFIGLHQSLARTCLNNMVCLFEAPFHAPCYDYRPSEKHRSRSSHPHLGGWCWRDPSHVSLQVPGTLATGLLWESCVAKQNSELGTNMFEAFLSGMLYGT